MSLRQERTARPLKRLCPKRQQRHRVRQTLTWHLCMSSSAPAPVSTTQMLRGFCPGFTVQVLRHLQAGASGRPCAWGPPAHLGEASLGLERQACVAGRRALEVLAWRTEARGSRLGPWAASCGRSPVATGGPAAPKRLPVLAAECLRLQHKGARNLPASRTPARAAPRPAPLRPAAPAP